jgi:hypothetical protein
MVHLYVLFKLKIMKNLIFIFVIMLCIFTSCEESVEIPTGPPIVEGHIVSVSGNQIQYDGVLSPNAERVLSLGVMYSTSPNLTFENVYRVCVAFPTTIPLEAKSTDFPFHCDIVTTIFSDSTYYVRAFAVNSYGYGYGETEIITIP